jgi:predicted nucleic acid-binding protein
MGRFAGRIAVVDGAAADAAGLLAAHRQIAGRGVDFRDTLIAGVAIARGAAIATRNTRHFQDLPVPVIDPGLA